MVTTDELRDKLTRAAAAAAEGHRRFGADRARSSANILAGADQGSGLIVDRRGRYHPNRDEDSTVDRPPQTLEVGTRRESFIELRARHAATAHRRLQENPNAAHDIGNRFKEAVYKGYISTRPNPDAPKIARYEAIRAWHGVTSGFVTDKPLRQALDTVRTHAERREPLTVLIPPESGRVYRGFTSFGPSVEFYSAMSRVLRRPIDDFWRECQAGGKYEEFYKEYRRSRDLDDEVMRQWYDGFKHGMEKGGGTNLDYNEFIAEVTGTGLEDLQLRVNTQVDIAALDVSKFHFAAPSLSPELKQDMFRRSIPALAERALLTRVGFQRLVGKFEREHALPEPDMDVLNTEAHRALGLQPHEDLTTPLQPRGLEIPARCPAPHIKSGDGTPSNEVVLELAAYLAPETYWRPR
ncbi:hypothetical protein ABZV91_32455 [Nocardia sp. NPDC004568]|uniref:hypothetical protein n=1 Tax=Nocardia sp. NPDC004568 TaxID=3154551 RepID=UPI0033BE692D